MSCCFELNFSTRFPIYFCCKVQLEQVREEREQEKAVSAETSSVNSVELSSPSLSVSSPSEVRQKSPSPKSKRKT